jgi:hypothetical protein
MAETSDRQLQFLRADKKHVGFGGARGGGKSWAVRAKAKLLCLRYPGIKVLIVRKTYGELLNNHINTLRGDLHGIARYNKSEKIFSFQNGSTIKFGYCACDSDLDQYQGAEYDVIFLDEATQLQEMWIKKITACVRGVNKFPKRIYYTCNPGGPSHGYIKRLFLDRRYEEGENPDDYVFIKSLVTDNKALMKEQPDYIRQLEALPPKLREAWLHGNWDIFEGQFFEDFRETPDRELCKAAGITPEEAVQQRRFTHVIEPFDMSRGEAALWTIMRSYDFGYHKPFSVGYWAVDFQGTLYRILEYYGCTKEPNEGVRWAPDQQFRTLREFEDSHPWLKGREIADSIADPSIWDTSRGESTAETAARYGIYFTPGDNHRIPGWMQVHYRLQFDENGFPRMYIFKGCEAFIRTIPLMMHAETKPEDLDTALEDHVADEVRYMCMSRPIKPIIPREEQVYQVDPLNQYQQLPIYRRY